MQIECTTACGCRRHPLRTTAAQNRTGAHAGAAAPCTLAIAAAHAVLAAHADADAPRPAQARTGIPDAIPALVISRSTLASARRCLPCPTTPEILARRRGAGSRPRRRQPPGADCRRLQSTQYDTTLDVQRVPLDSRDLDAAVSPTRQGVGPKGRVGVASGAPDWPRRAMRDCGRHRSSHATRVGTLGLRMLTPALPRKRHAYPGPVACNSRVARGGPNGPIRPSAPRNRQSAITRRIRPPIATPHHHGPFIIGSVPLRATQAFRKPLQKGNRPIRRLRAALRKCQSDRDFSPGGAR